MLNNIYVFNPTQREDYGQNKYKYKFVQLDRTMQKQKACNIRLKKNFKMKRNNIVL